MSAKENEASKVDAVPFIKPEPEEHKILTPGENAPDVKSPSRKVKPEPIEATRGALNRVKPEPDTGYDNLGAHNYGIPAAEAQLPPRAAPLSRTASKNSQPLYKVFKSLDDINYLPEDALKEGLGMVKTIKANIKTLEVGSKLRKDVWLREIESLQSQGAPTTMIAVCGATGAGKSSILNAILDDNVVPTSGMRACTAVVTEISYHAKKTIDADISFLSEKEWREELAVLLKDMIDEDGNVKRTTDLRGEAGVAWSKVHAVYPKITQDMLAKMSVDQIIARDPNIRAILGTTKHVCAHNSQAFAKEIAKYIDSKEKKHGKKNKKDKEKNKEASGSLMDILKKDNKKKDKDEDGPAFWPLIRQVQVKCDSPALSTGAILVDLPGVADANAARNNIAKDYMKKCDCIWILAPITRAVDDKTARDLMGDAFKMQLMNGVYDDHAITFIASKCDDVSCSEVIQALSLDDEPELEKIEEQIDRCKEETNEWRRKKIQAEDSAKDIDSKLKEIRAYLAEYQEHKKALQNGDPFERRLTATGSGKKGQSASRGKKRKNNRGGKKGSKKRRSGSASSDNDDFIDDDSDSSESDSDSDSQEESDKSDSDDDDASDASGSESSDKEDGNEESTMDVEEEEVTIESLERKISEAKEAIKAGRVELSEFRKQKKEANDMLATLKKKQVKTQRDKNAFCSLRRSEFSRDVLKEDFRQGLKDLDDAAAEERDPDSFDPTKNLRDYSAIDLPVFTCSARDYVRIKGQVKGDGDPSCFCRVEDTGIPELQKWCHTLTVASRERAARNFLIHLKTFGNSVRSYVEGIGDVTVTDREAMRAKWESMQDDGDEDEDDMDAMLYGGGWASSDPLDDMDALDPYALAGLPRANLYSMHRPAAPKVDGRGEPIGITPRLVKDFKQVVRECVKGLQDRFRDGLEEKCKTGAENASSAALETSDAFAASMHWGTYRATLRRHGSWRQDLNVELTNPFTRQIASSWQKVFEADLFSAFEKSTLFVIDNLLKDVEESAAPGLKERARGQGELCLQEAKIALKKTMDVVRDTMSSQQKETSRSLAPHVQEQLFDGYDAAMEERGLGSVARQKAVFHNYVSDIKDEMFEGAVDVLFGRLDTAAEAVGKALEEAFEALAQKIEVSIAVLWEGVRDDPAQVKAREAVIASMTEIIAQVNLWQQADAVRRQPADAMNMEGEEE